MKNRTALPAAEFKLPEFLPSIAYFMLIVQLMYTMIKLHVHARYMTRRRNRLTRRDAIVPDTKLHAAILERYVVSKASQEQNFLTPKSQGDACLQLR